MRSTWPINSINIAIVNGLLILPEEVQLALIITTSITHQTIDEKASLPNSKTSSSAWTLLATLTKVVTPTMSSIINIIVTMPRSMAVAAHPQ